MSITLEQIEYFLMILVRISAFAFTAPFFNIPNVPNRVKAGFSIIVSIILFSALPYAPLEYTGVIGYGILVLKDAILGASMGFFANIAQYILAFVGQQIDIEIGFSMITEYNPVAESQVTISGTFYTYAVMLMMLVTNMHYYILEAIIDSFVLVPVGGAQINVSIYELMTAFMKDYFILGFRIVLPMFASILLVNTILAILAKVAPQMNMFAIGIQLKLLVGLVILFFMVQLIPGVADLIFNEMIELMKATVVYFEGS